MVSDFIKEFLVKDSLKGCLFCFIPLATSLKISFQLKKFNNNQKNSRYSILYEHLLQLPSPLAVYGSMTHNSPLYPRQFALRVEARRMSACRHFLC